jgi:putative flippase GtrA
MSPSRLQSAVSRAIEDMGEWFGLLKKAASFAAVGVINTAVDVSVFAAGYIYLGLPLVPANVMSWFVAVSGSYVMNSMTTFAAESGRKLSYASYGKFVASGVAGVIVNTTVLVLMSYVAPIVVAKLCAVAASFLVNFSLSHFVVFRPQRKPPAKPRA